MNRNVLYVNRFIIFKYNVSAWLAEVAFKENLFEKNCD